MLSLPNLLFARCVNAKVSRRNRSTRGQWARILLPVDPIIDPGWTATKRRSVIHEARCAGRINIVCMVAVRHAIPMGNLMDKNFGESLLMLSTGKTGCGQDIKEVVCNKRQWPVRVGVVQAQQHIGHPFHMEPVCPRTAKQNQVQAPHGLDAHRVGDLGGDVV